MVTRRATNFVAPRGSASCLLGIAVPVPGYIKSGDNRGKEHITREMTGEADYERLLENTANGKGLASPTGLEPVLPP